MPRQRDIFLAPFPFSDEDVEKRRPVLIISNSIHNSSGKDVIVMAITSNLSGSTVGIEIGADSLDEGHLPAPSRVLPIKVYSLAQHRLEKYICRLNAASFGLAIETLNDALTIL